MALTGASQEGERVKQPQRRSGRSVPWRRQPDVTNPVSPARSSLHVELSPVWESVRRCDHIAGAAGVSSLLRRDAQLRRTLALVDVIAAYSALLIAVYLVGDGSVSLRSGALVIGPVIILASKMIGLYDRDQYLLRKTTIDEVPQILYLSVLYALAVWLCEALLFHGWLARPQVFALTVCSFMLITISRSLARRGNLAMTAAERCIVLGSAVNAARIATKLEQAGSTNAVVIGRVSVDARHGARAANAPRKLGDYGSLVRVVAEHEVERVIIAPGSGDEDKVLDAIRVVKALGIKVSVLPRLLEVVGSSSTFDDVDGIWLLGVRPYGLSKSSELLKRGMDLAGATAALIVLFPLMLMLALAVRLSSRGPVFFSQKRIGCGGEMFQLLKFRSMVADADDLKDTLQSLNEAEGGLFKIREDPRCTRVGRFIRRTSLDELPQLLSVVRGDMSLVGPRPLVPDEDAMIEGWQRRRLAVRPGMTGLWQIFGSSRVPMHEMVKIDYLYGANWSIWLDLKILLRTIPYVIGQRGL
jgi:exopolysaccharide biosynthesis polyprenyl glycosylphosphotransferase